MDGGKSDPEQIRHQFGGIPIGVPEMLRRARGFGLKPAHCDSACDALVFFLVRARAAGRCTLRREDLDGHRPSPANHLMRAPARDGARAASRCRLHPDSNAEDFPVPPSDCYPV